MQSKGGCAVFQPIIETYVHCVWLAKGGRKRLKATRVQLIIHSTKHGTNLTLIELYKVSIFLNYRLGKTQKKNFVAKWVQILKK